MYSRHRLPGEIISYCVWLYYTFPLSYRDIEKMMLYRGIEVTYESIREWCQKFGQQYANQLRRKRPYVTDKWNLDEMVVTIKKQQYYLWPAVESEGNVLDVLVQCHRDTEAAQCGCFSAKSRLPRESIIRQQDGLTRGMVAILTKCHYEALKPILGECLSAYYITLSLSQAILCQPLLALRDLVRFAVILTLKI